MIIDRQSYNIIYVKIYFIYNYFHNFIYLLLQYNLYNYYHSIEFLEQNNDTRIYGYFLYFTKFN